LNRRPDVSVSSDGNITIHSFEERNGLKLSLLHYPFCVSFVFFEDKQSNHHMVCDPLDIEEESADGSVIVCANSYHEIVGLHCSGKSVGRQNLNKCFNTAIEKVKQITTELKRALELDNSKRCDKSLKFGFAHALHSGLMASLQKPHFNLLDVIKTDAIEEKESMETSNEEIETQNVYLYGRGIASIGEGGESKWKFINTIDSDEEVMQMEHNLIKSQSNSNQFNKSDDEEEDDIIILDSNNLSHT
jgi:exosome complex component RRP45